jgi:hypothetical protein
MMDIVRSWQNVQVRVREEDGYVNATALGSAFGKSFAEFSRNACARTHIEAIAEVYSLSTGLQHDTESSPAAKRVVEPRGGDSDATWIHPRVATQYALWLNTHFGVWLADWLAPLAPLAATTSSSAEVVLAKASVAAQQEAARPRPLYRNQCCILNEADLHIATVDWLSRAHPDACTVAGIVELIDSPEKRARACRMGYRAGQPDLMILESDGEHRGLAIEFKHPGFEVLEPRPEQRAYHAKLRALGWEVLVCNDLCGASIAIDAYLRRAALLCGCCGLRWESARALEVHKQRKRPRRSSGA